VATASCSWWFCDRRLRDSPSYSPLEATSVTFYSARFWQEGYWEIAEGGGQTKKWCSYRIVMSM
jgi:hypothetical protein